MAKVSFSQYSMYSTCPRQYKHQYIDNLSESSTNINLLFGTAMHETIQQFLSVMYVVSKKQAMEMNTDKILLESMRSEFLKENSKLSKGTICTQLELEEFYGDGRRILEWFKKHINKFYTNTGVELVGIEIPLNVELKTGVHFIGFVDIVLREIGSGKIIIIDLKTSTRGWSSYDKNDKFKNAQIVLYKKYYSDLFGVPLEKITVEYQILRRKLLENSPYPIPYVSKHIPASGKPTVNKVHGEFMEFVNTIFDETGNRRTTISYPKVPGKSGKNCKWCEFKQRGICDGKAS
jgi:hypothetical protein